MPYVYRNDHTGQVVEREQPWPRLEASDRWTTVERPEPEASTSSTGKRKRARSSGDGAAGD